MKYYITISGTEYEFTPSNFSSCILDFKKPDNTFVSVYPSNISISIHENEFRNIGFNDFSGQIKRQGESQIRISEGIFEEVFKFTFKEITYDDFKLMYDIQANNINGISNYDERKDTDIDLYSFNIIKTDLSGIGYTGEIKDCMRVNKVLEVLIKECFGQDFLLSSVFYTSLPLYICQSSNVIKAVDNVVYNNATKFPNFSFKRLINDLTIMHNIRMSISGKTIRIEPYETFENEKINSGVGFDATLPIYSGYLDSQKTYSFETEDVKSEVWKSDNSLELFENKTLKYKEEGKVEEYEMIGYTDLTGITLRTDDYSNSNYCFLYSTDGMNIDSTTTNYPTVSNFELDDFYESGLFYTRTDDSNEFKRSSNEFSISKYTFVSDVFILDNPSNVQFVFSTDMYQRAKDVSDIYNYPFVGVRLKTYIADSSQKTISNTWASCKISNEIYTEKTQEFYKDSEGKYKLFTYNQEQFYYAFISFSGELSSNANNNCVIVHEFEIGMYQISAFDKILSPPYYFILSKGYFIEGTYTYLNDALRFANLVPTYHKYDRYAPEGVFDNTQLALYEKRIKKGQSILSLGSIDEFDTSRFINTQFGVGEIDSVNYDIFKKQITISGMYQNEFRFGKNADILSFYFDEATNIRMIDNLIICQAALGTDLSTITPIIKVSPYASYTVLNSSYATDNTIIVTSEDGQTTKTYTVIITIAQPRFAYSGVLCLINLLPYTNQRWIHSDGVINNSFGWSRFVSGGASGTVILDYDDYENSTSFQAQGLIGSLNLTGFDSLETVQVTVSILNEVILPDNNFTSITISGCRLTSFDFSNFTNLDNSIIILSANDLNPNKILIDLDESGFINGTIDVTGNGVLNLGGETARDNLFSKGWVVLFDIV